MTSPDQAILLWNVVWHLQIPPKARHFLWRAIYNVLPSKDRLARKGVVLDLSCEWCRSDLEDNLHAIVLCPCSKAVSDLADLGVILPSSADSDFPDWASLCEMTRLLKRHPCFVGQFGMHVMFIIFIIAPSRFQL